MQVLLLGLFVALYLHDMTTAVTVPGGGGALRQVEALPSDVWPQLGPLPVALLVLGPKLVLMLVYQAACLQTCRRLGKPGGHRAFDRLEKLTAALPLMLLGLFVADLWLGGLRLVRLALRHVVLVDELVILLPTLGAAVFAWWAYYPVDRRLREAAIMRQADAGQPVYPMLDRGRYVSMQVRHQFGLLLVPLAVIFAWAESLVLLGPGHQGLLSEAAVVALTPAGVLGVFVLAPLIIRYVWHTTPLPSGEVRERMLELCRHHRVKVRQLLLWRTGGGLINAAVTGLVAPLRYILLSDGLLDQVPPRQVEAVMAHELAHVKCKHIIWMGLVLLVTLGLAEAGGYALLDAMLQGQRVPPDASALLNLTDPQTQVLVVSGPAFAIALLVFGWVSRRIERQADVFAARHLAATRGERVFDDQARHVFDAESVGTMVGALQRVAELNHAPVHRKSWRHGSIAWRQDHLRSLVGRPVNQATVDRTMARVKLATLAGLAVLIAIYIFSS